MDTDNKHGITNIDLEKVEIDLHELTDRYNRDTENHGVEDIEIDNIDIHKLADIDMDNIDIGNIDKDS